MILYLTWLSLRDKVVTVTIRPVKCSNYAALFFVDSSSYCGGSAHCFRPSFTPDTWSNAWQTCHALNGSLASINIDDDLPTGKFWVAIKKDVQWRWLDGMLFVVTFYFKS